MAAAWSKWHSIRGRMTALFLAGYGTIRFVTEFTREADPQLGYVASFLTMGQMLCLLMISMAVIVHRYEPNLNTTS